MENGAFLVSNMKLFFIPLQNQYDIQKFNDLAERRSLSGVVPEYWILTSQEYIYM